MQNILSFHPHADVQNTPIMPYPLTTMLGRQQEIAQLYAMFEQRRSRLITLSGPAGVGKTHLALTFVPMVASYFVDGSFFVDLASIRDASLVIPAIIRALGNERLDSLSALSLYLRDRHILLLLDNFEQVIAASSLLCQLLSSCPYLTILVTSRSTLNIRGEHEFVVAPLALPPHSYTVDACELMEFAAVQLFVQRAQAANACFELNASNAAVIAEICRRLDGLPLAIELGAARSKHFSSFQLLTLLQNKVHLLTQGPNDLPTRQQTLYNTVQWSYELLQPEEQKLFRLCSVVRGACTLELLGHLNTCDSLALMNTVTALINSSLLQSVEWLDDCYAWKMPGIIRDFGLQLLADCDELEPVQNRYIHYYQQLAQRAEHGLFGRERVLWQRRMHAEYENLQEIVHLFIEQNREHEASAMGKVLYLSSFFHEHVEEEFSWLKRLLANHAHTRLSARARALYYLGASAFFQSRVLMAQAYLEQALQLYQDLEEPLAYARAACMLGYSSFIQADYEASKKWIAIAIAGFKDNEETVCRQEYGYANAIQALIAVYEDQDLCATACAREALRQFEELDNQRGIVIARYTLAQAYFRASEHEKARLMLEKAIFSGQEAHLFPYVVLCAQLLSAVMALQGDEEQAVVLWSANEALRMAHQEQLRQKNPLDLLTPGQQSGTLKDMRARLGSKTFAALWQRGQQMTVEQALRPEKSKPTYIHQRNPNYLTRRETEVLCLVATGLTDAQAAHTLSLSARTISWHLASIYSKIHVSSRAAATRYALENRLLDQPPHEKHHGDSEMIL